MRDKFFNWMGRIAYRRYGLILLIGLVVTILLGGAASNIRMETNWMSMLPQDAKSVTDFKTAIDEFGAITNVILAVEGPDRATVIEAANDLAPDLQSVVIEYKNDDGQLVKQESIKRVDYKYDIDYLKNHGMMLEKAKNLKKNIPMFTDYNLVPFFTHLNDVYEEQYVSDNDNLTKQEKEAVRGLDGMYQLFGTLEQFITEEDADSALVRKGVDEFLIGDGYYLSSDKKMLLMFISPTISINDFMASIALVDSLEARMDPYREKYKDVRFSLTGMQALTRDEMNAGMNDTARNLTFALILILAIFIISFRMWTGPIMAMVVLIGGVIWDIGIAQLIFGRLNIMTAMCSVILIGLGIDFAIHIISSYTELRHKGISIADAVAQTYSKIGTGLVTGALTTSIAFISIMVVGSSAFVEFGLVVGIGVICCLLISLFLLPAMLVAKEKLWAKIRKNAKPKMVDMEFKFVGRSVSYGRTGAIVIVIASIVITVLIGLKIPDGRMNNNYMDLEPEGLESVRLQREIVKRFHMSPDNMIAIYDNLDDVDEIQDRLNSKPSVGMVESIASVLPSVPKQEKRQPLVAEIRKIQDNIPPLKPVDTKALIEQLYRLSDNLTEMSSSAYVSGLDKVFDKTNEFIGLDADGNQVGINRADQFIDRLKKDPELVKRLNDYQDYFRPIMIDEIRRMSNPENINMSMVPESYREKYVSKDSSHYLVTFYSKKDIWDGLYTSPFLKTMLRNVPNATGTPIFMSDMVERSKVDGSKAFGIALIAIFILLLIDFRSIKTALVALIPLVMSVTLLFGLMGLLDIRYTIINVIGFPLLLGIGIDDGVHVIHRYRIEGKDKLPYAMSSIGKAIVLTSVTTILGFGSLMTSEYRGYIGLGLIVSLGIGLCLITSVVVLPAFLKLIWGGKKDHPKFFKA